MIEVRIWIEYGDYFSKLLMPVKQGSMRDGRRKSFEVDGEMSEPIVTLNC